MGKKFSGITSAKKFTSILKKRRDSKTRAVIDIIEEAIEKREEMDVDTPAEAPIIVDLREHSPKKNEYVIEVISAYRALGWLFDFDLEEKNEMLIRIELTNIR
jgi:hypothetical protein